MKNLESIPQYLWILLIIAALSLIWLIVRLPTSDEEMSDNEEGEIEPKIEERIEEECKPPFKEIKESDLISVSRENGRVTQELTSLGRKLWDMAETTPSSKGSMMIYAKEVEYWGNRIRIQEIDIDWDIHITYEITIERI